MHIWKEVNNPSRKVFKVWKKKWPVSMLWWQNSSSNQGAGNQATSRITTMTLARWWPILMFFPHLTYTLQTHLLLFRRLTRPEDCSAHELHWRRQSWMHRWTFITALWQPWASLERIVLCVIIVTPHFSKYTKLDTWGESATYSQ